MKRFILIVVCLWWVLALSCKRVGERPTVFDNTPRVTYAPGFVYLDSAQFYLDSMPWYPLMLNYKLQSSLDPASYYTEGGFDSHFSQIEEMGFNALRICMDVLNSDASGYMYGKMRVIDDSAAIFEKVQNMLSTAAAHHLRVMLLLKAPLEQQLQEFTAALLRHFAHDPTLFAYDFMNEPLYFDPVKDRSKDSCYSIVDGWRQMMTDNAPNQLFTIGFSEPIEVFCWDASVLPVDFVEIHTYHPLRISSEMYWYHHFVRKPFMIGETALPADGDSISYDRQAEYLVQSYRQARNYGAIGYGWWEFQDCPQGVNFEAQYPGMLDAEGRRKPVADRVKSLKLPDTLADRMPVNYYNMLGYSNIMLEGRVISVDTKFPVKGAVVRGWNRDWSVGINSYTDNNGYFHLYSNDSCVYFTVSAPGYRTSKQFKRTDYALYSRKSIRQFKLDSLPYKTREYQQIPLLEFLRDTTFFGYQAKDFNQYRYKGNLGSIELEPLQVIR